MIELILGKEGEGKTKYMLERADEALKATDGSIVYIDKDASQSLRINNKIRLVNMQDFDLTGYKYFMGFILGLCSQDHDIDKIFVDSLFKITKSSKEDLEDMFNRFNAISASQDVDFVFSINADKDDIPAMDSVKIIAAL